MAVLKFLAWLLLHVGVPLLAPIALLPLVYASSRHRSKVGTLARRALQEGQLFWTVIAMCAAACYEAAAHVATGQDQEIDRAITSIAVGWHVIMIVASSVLVLLGALDALDEGGNAAGRLGIDAARAMPRIMVVSIGMAAVTAVTYSATRIWAV